MQQVRTSEPHAKDCGEGAEIEWEAMDGEARKACTCDWAVRVDARLAACVEAYGRAIISDTLYDGAFWGADAKGTHGYLEVGLAAFLAAPAKKETTT